jgi:hypothetical protein
MNGRLLAELAVVVAVGGFAYMKIAPRWQGWTQPLKPVETDVAPSAPLPGERSGAAGARLSAPAASRSAAPVQTSMHVVQERIQADDVAVMSARPRVTGDSAQVFERAKIEQGSLALAKPAAAAQDLEAPTWAARLKRLDPRAVAAGIVALFVLLYVILARSLHAPGDKPLTHE